MDSLCITALQVSTHIGVHAWEQQIKQTLLLDIEVPVDCSICQEKLENTLDYDALCTAVTQYIEGKSFQLVETVAEEIAQLIKDTFKVQTLSLRVSKPQAIKNAANVSFRMQR